MILPLQKNAIRSYSLVLKAVLVLCLLLPANTRAQDDVVALPDGDSLCVDTTSVRPFKEFVKRTGKKVKETIRYLDKYDTTYIEPDHYNWTFMGQNSQFFQLILMSAKQANGKYQTLSFSPKPTLKIGPYIGWRWIFVGYTIDVSRPAKAGKATEFNFSVYSSKLGADFIYIRNKNNFMIRRTKGFEGIKKKEYSGENFTGLSVYTISGNVYYVFNHRKFSYPAAYNQSTVQKRSAGSFVMGFRYDHQHMNFDYTKLPQGLLGADSLSSPFSDELKFTSLSYQDFCISAGYAYNWVFARNCLLSISATPAIGYRKEKGEKVKYNKPIEKAMRYVAFDFIGRAGIVWNTKKCFAGASFVTHIYGYHSRHLNIANSVNYLNIYSGFYFGKKKSYR